MRRGEGLVLRGGRDLAGHDRDLAVADGKVVTADLARGWREVDLAGRTILPGLVNAHDHLDASTLPPLGAPPYRSLYEWLDSVDPDGPELRAGLDVPLSDRHFLGGLRNLLAGATAVLHHGPYHRGLGREGFPVRVQARYDFAHSPGLTPALRRAYRTTDRRVPWIVHAAEGTDERCAAEVAALRSAGVLRQNTVVVHGQAVDEASAPALAEARACVVWCPEASRRLYGAATPVGLLRANGVRVGLGSDSPATGARDLLSTLAAARAEAVLGDAELLDQATRDSAEVARLPVGGLEAGCEADLLVVDDVAALLSGDRRAVSLVVVAGRALYGAPELVGGGAEVEVDGVRRRLDEALLARASRIAAAHRGLTRRGWLGGLVLQSGPLARPE